VQLERTRFALENVREFIAQAGSNPLIENFLVQYLLVSFYSEVEDTLARILRARIAAVTDSKLAVFIATTNEAMIRRVKKSEINDILKKFGCDEASCVGDELDGMNLQPYFDAIANRHSVAHGSGCDMTLDEFERAIPCAERIFLAVQEAIAP
jgi:hypothetical protein